MVELSESDVAFLRERQLAHLATVAADGTPRVTPVWIDTDGTHVLFNTVQGRVKHRDLVRDPHVAISIADRENDYRNLWVRGTVEFVEDGAEDNLDALAKKYLGVDKYPGRHEGEVRVIGRVTVTWKRSRG